MKSLQLKFNLKDTFLLALNEDMHNKWVLEAFQILTFGYKI